jgi:hypothetical protein
MNRVFVIIFSLLIGSSSLFGQTGAGCATAIVVTPGTYVVDSITALSSTYFDAKKAKWYKYTPATSGLMTITSCLQGSDTRLSVLTGRCDSLVPFAFNDDYCFYENGSSDLWAAGLRRLVTAGKPYFIEWDNRWDSMRFSFNLDLSAYSPTAGQSCATAIAIGVGVTRVDSLTGFPTRGDVSRSNWYKYTPTRNGKIGVSSCNGGGATRLWIYRGSCTNLLPVADNDDACAYSATDLLGLASAVSGVDVVANTTYYLEWDDQDGDSGFNFSLVFDPTSGTDDIQLGESVRAFPNPTEDAITLEYTLTQPNLPSFRLLNLLGQELHTALGNTLGSGSAKFDLTGLPSGIYLVEIRNGGARALKKVVKY